MRRLTEHEIRNPNSRNPKEGRNPKAENHGRLGPEKVRVWRPGRAALSGFGLRISFGSRISDFGFWVELIRAPFLSPLGFVARALLLGVIFAICELAGWREHTTFISGTAASANAGINSSVTLGLIYMLAYFGVVLAAPVLLIAAALLTAWHRRAEFVAK